MFVLCGKVSVIKTFSSGLGSDLFLEWTLRSLCCGSPLYSNNPKSTPPTHTNTHKHVLSSPLPPHTWSLTRFSLPALAGCLRVDKSKSICERARPRRTFWEECLQRRCQNQNFGELQEDSRRWGIYWQGNMSNCTTRLRVCTARIISAAASSIHQACD